MQKFYNIFKSINLDCVLYYVKPILELALSVFNTNIVINIFVKIQK